MGQLVELSPMEHMQLTALVREIVHPDATPDLAMMAIATRQGRTPKTMIEMMEYTPLFVELATQMGVKPPGSTGPVTPQEMQELMITRGAQWLQHQTSLAAMTGGAMGLGSENAGMEGVLGMGIGSMPFTAAMTGGAMGLGSENVGMEGVLGMGMGGMPFSASSPMSMMMLDGAI